MSTISYPILNLTLTSKKATMTAPTKTKAEFRTAQRMRESDSPPTSVNLSISVKVNGQGKMCSRSAHHNVSLSTLHRCFYRNASSRKYQDTFFDNLVFHSSQLLHHNVNETCDEARQKANQAADHPATDL